jgi:hypothetical protein
MEEWAENAHQFVRIAAPKDGSPIGLDSIMDNLPEAEDSLSNRKDLAEKPISRQSL